MNHWQLLIFCTITWLVWIPAVVMEKKAKGDKGYTSVFPVIPFFPLIAWLVGIGLDRVKVNLGSLIISAAHVILLVCLIVSIVISSVRMTAKK